MIDKSKEPPNKIKEYEAIKEFFTKKKQKCKGYETGFKRFFDFLGKNPDDYFPIIEDTETRKIPTSTIQLLDMDEHIRKDITKRIYEYERDIEKFFEHLKGESVSIKTINNYMIQIRVLFRFYGATEHIDSNIWENVRINESKPNGDFKYKGTKEQIITREILQDIIKETGDLKIKAIITFLVSSGVRRGELFQLALDDINLNSEPVTVTVRSEVSKTGKERITFISKEAKEYLNMWLKKGKDRMSPRERYIKLSYERATIKKEVNGKTVRVPRVTRFGATMTKTKDDNRIFPLSASVFNRVWNRLLHDSGHGARDKNTTMKYHKYRIHGLRKYFRRMGAKAKHPNNETLIEKMMGHEGYLSHAEYDRQDIEDLKKYYRLVEKEGFLTIDITEQQLQKQKQEVEKIKEEMQKQKKFLKEYIADINKRLDKSDIKVTDLKGRLD